MYYFQEAGPRSVAPTGLSHSADPPLSLPVHCVTLSSLVSHLTLDCSPLTGTASSPALYQPTEAEAAPLPRSATSPAPLNSVVPGSSAALPSTLETEQDSLATDTLRPGFLYSATHKGQARPASYASFSSLSNKGGRVQLGGEMRYQQHDALQLEREQLGAQHEQQETLEDDAAGNPNGNPYAWERPLDAVNRVSSSRGAVVHCSTFFNCPAEASILDVCADLHHLGLRKCSTRGCSTSHPSLPRPPSRLGACHAYLAQACSTLSASPLRPNPPLTIPPSPTRPTRPLVNARPSSAPLPSRALAVPVHSDRLALTLPLRACSPSLPVPASLPLPLRALVGLATATRTAALGWEDSRGSRG